MIDESIVGRLERVIDQKAANASRGGSQSASGTATRVDPDGTVWVRLAGASTDTPCRTTTVAVKPGDSVAVEVGGGSARITGNVSSPSTDDETALKAQASADRAIEDAGRARTAAESAEASAVAALQSADAAATAADDAQASADQAYESAVQAIDDARIAGISASIAQAAAEAAQGDDPVYMNHWFYHDTLGAHVLGDSDGYRTDVSSTGMQVVDTSDQQAVVSVGAGSGQFGKSNGYHLVLLPTELSLRDPNDLRVAYIEVDSQGNSLFYVANAVIVDDLRFGGGDWKWAARQNRNLSLKWMGGSV